jgi:DNA-binding MarR family transcriptional regulator
MDPRGMLRISIVVVGGSIMQSPVKKRASVGDAGFSSDGFGPYLLRRISERLSRSLGEALKPYGEHPNMWRVLVALITRDSATIGQLAHLTMIEQSTLSRTILRMKKQRLVSCTPARRDGRMVEVSLTAAGRRSFHEILPVATAQYDWAIRGIPERDLEVFMVTLQHMLKNLRFSPIK